MNGMLEELWRDFLTVEGGAIRRMRGRVVAGSDGQHKMRDSQAVAQVMRLFPLYDAELREHEPNVQLWQVNLDSGENQLRWDLPLCVIGRPSQFKDDTVRDWLDGYRPGWCLGGYARSGVGHTLGGRFYVESDERESQDQLPPPEYRTFRDERRETLRWRSNVDEAGARERVDHGVVFRAWHESGRALMAIWGTSSLGTYGAAVFATSRNYLAAWGLPDDLLTATGEQYPLEILVETRVTGHEAGYQVTPAHVRVLDVRWGGVVLDRSGACGVWVRDDTWHLPVRLEAPRELAAGTRLRFVDRRSGRLLLEVPAKSHGAKFLWHVAKAYGGPCTYKDMLRGRAGVVEQEEYGRLRQRKSELQKTLREAGLDWVVEGLAGDEAPTLGFRLQRSVEVVWEEGARVTMRTSRAR
jgi:hypothetical protein